MPADPIAALIQAGAVAALVFVVYGFLWGPVFSARTVTMLLASKDAQLIDRDRQIDAEKKRVEEWQARVDRLEVKTLAMSEQLGRAVSALEKADSQLEEYRRRDLGSAPRSPRSGSGPVQ